MLLSLAIFSLLCALLPAGLFFQNLKLYQVPPIPEGDEQGAVSVLIPARNEESNIAGVLESVLGSLNVELEIVVLDDYSTDATAEIVRKFVKLDRRVRLESAAALPEAWNGKVHACHCLAQHARMPALLFIDADVRLTPDALQRLLPLLGQADLWSGLPRQLMGTFSERLLIPLIHFVLLGFLPLEQMRRTSRPSLGAGCGQLFLTKASAYTQVGGHAAIASSIHDGLHLPRLYRRFGFRTDLVDLTPVATCRMYHNNGSTWHGLAKNAHEGMGSWQSIVPMTVLLACGQIAPAVWLVMALWLPVPRTVMFTAVVALSLSFIMRLVSASRFQQPFLSALLHPVGMICVLGIQWWARARATLGFASTWRGRTYHA